MAVTWKKIAYSPHASEHHVGGEDLVNHDSLTGFLAAEHKSLPNTIAQVLSNHTKAVHDALGLSHDSLVDVSINDHHARNHQATHGPAAADALKLDDLAAPDDNTDLNASTVKHGLLKKLNNLAAQFLNGQGNWAVPAGSGASIKTGTYTGDGTEGQAITGVGFRPKYVRIWFHITGEGQAYSIQKLDQSWGDLAYTMYPPTYINWSFANKINSLDADGFTVDDGAGDNFPNSYDGTYDYLALG